MKLPSMWERERGRHRYDFGSCGQTGYPMLVSGSGAEDAARPGMRSESSEM
jgi:hypothetical protein